MELDFFLRPKEPKSTNKDYVVSLFRKIREQTDNRIVPEYWSTFTNDFFTGVWADFFCNPQNYKAWFLCDRKGGKDIGIVRTGNVDSFFFDYLDQPLPPQTGELHQIYLDQDYIGRGLGRRLYRQACEDLCHMGYRNMFLSTYLKNDRAKEFYIRSGADHMKDASVAVTLDSVTTHYDVSFFLHRRANLITGGSALARLDHV